MSSQPVNQVPTNPLAALTDPTSNFSSLQYPIDLEGSVGHYVNFYINVNKASQYYQSSSGFSYGQPGSPTYGIIPNVTSGNGGNVIFGNGTAGSGISLGSMTNQRIAQAISMYIPDSMGYGQNIKWENASLYELGNSLLEAGGALKSGIDKMAGGMKFNALKSVSAMLSNLNGLSGLPEGIATAGSAVDKIGGALGWAFNPQLLVLFRGIDFRSFQYDFYFSPRGTGEAAAVRNIIQAFRFHSHPELISAAGLFYGAPSTFDIQFMHGGAINTKIQQVSTCVLVGYDVDYAPYGWSTYSDGMPIQTRLSLRFQEMQILDKNKILQGY